MGTETEIFTTIVAHKISKQIYGEKVAGDYLLKMDSTTFKGKGNFTDKIQDFAVLYSSWYNELRLNCRDFVNAFPFVASTDNLKRWMSQCRPHCLNDGWSSVNPVQKYQWALSNKFNQAYTVCITVVLLVFLFLSPFLNSGQFRLWVQRRTQRIQLMALQTLCVYVWGGDFQWDESILHTNCSKVLWPHWFIALGRGIN